MIERTLYKRHIMDTAQRQVVTEEITGERGRVGREGRSRRKFLKIFLGRVLNTIKIIQHFSVAISW